MCGIVGYVSFKPQAYGTEKRRFMIDNLYINALRGMESTGVALVHKDLVTCDVYKRDVASHDYLDLPATKRLFSRIEDAVVVLGHTRSSTKGMISNENAHPFQHGGITMVHNGHVANHRSLVNFNEFDSQVDSEFVAYALSKAKDPIEVLEKIDGGFTLCWHDAVRKTFNIARNKERPLTWVYINDWDGIAFASEQGFLAATLERDGIQMSGRNEKDKTPKYWEPNVNTLFTWDLSKPDVRGYVSTPFSRKLPRIVAGARTGSTGTGTTTGTSQPLPLGEIKTTPSDVDVNRKLYPLRPQLTKHATRWRPVTERQKGKAKRRLHGMGIEIDTVYGIVPKLWLPYTDQRDVGVMVGRMRNDINGKTVRVMIHDVEQATYNQNWDRHFLVTARGSYNLEGLGTFVLCELDDEDDDPTIEQMTLEELMAADPALDLVEGPGGTWIPIAEWETKAKDGCGICQSALDVNESDKVIWVGHKPHETPICELCMANPDNHEYIEGRSKNARLN